MHPLVYRGVSCIFKPLLFNKNSNELLKRKKTSFTFNYVVQMEEPLCFLKDDADATAIEYGLIPAGISIAIIASVFALGTVEHRLPECLECS